MMRMVLLGVPNSISYHIVAPDTFSCLLWTFSRFYSFIHWKAEFVQQLYVMVFRLLISAVIPIVNAFL